MRLFGALPRDYRNCLRAICRCQAMQLRNNERQVANDKHTYVLLLPVGRHSGGYWVDCDAQESKAGTRQTRLGPGC